MSKLYISRVQHPLFRTFLKFLAGCIFGRPNNHLTRLVGVTVLAHFCQPDSHSSVFLPKSILAHLLSIITLKTNIVYGGVISLLASRIPHLQFRDPNPISANALISLTLLKNAHDIQTQRSAGARIQYIWILNPNPNNVLNFLPEECLISRFTNQPHYCIPNAVPRSIHLHLRAEERKRKRRLEGLPSESEEEEDGGSESEEDSGERITEPEIEEPSTTPQPRSTPPRGTPTIPSPTIPSQTISPLLTPPPPFVYSSPPQTQPIMPSFEYID